MTGGKKFVIESQSLYHLHPFEGLGVAIPSIIFNENNYNLCQKIVWTSLKGKNEPGFIDSTLTRPKPKGVDNLSQIKA